MQLSISSVGQNYHRIINPIPTDGIAILLGGLDQMACEWQEKLVEKSVIYTLEWEGKFYIVENVPARIDEETGERYFSPETVEHLQQLIWAHHEPTRIAEIPVYDFAA